MKKRTLPWWQLPALVTGGVAAVGTLGTLAVNYATYASLPSKVEAGEQRNELQDNAILELKKSNEIWQQIYQQQTQSRVQLRWDAQAQRAYCDDGQQQWWVNAQGSCE